MLQVQDAGLFLAYVFPNAESLNAEALVAEQFPLAGTLVPPGTPIYLFVKTQDQTCP
jgi:hypothetical protein